MSASSLAEPIAVDVPAESDSAQGVRWSLATRIAFRFFFTFFLLAYFPFPLTFLQDLVQKGWDAIVVAVGESVFAMTPSTVPNGSGDKAADWIQWFVIVVASAAVALVWSIADRKAVSYPRLFRWFHVYIRFALFYVMMVYGVYKLIPSQFATPSLDRLMQPLGDMSPMGLLWTFMGSSVAYTMFSGLGEVVGGILLTMRRTTLLGALISAAVMTQVVALNFMYDVPVKAFSSFLLLNALVIAAPDARRLWDFFIASRPVEPLFARRRLRLAATAIAVLFVVYVIGKTVEQSWEQRQMLVDERLTAVPFKGVWTVAELTEDGVARPPLVTDLTRWRRLIVSGQYFVFIQNMDDSRMRVRLTVDTKKKTVTVDKWRKPAPFKVTFQYRRPDPKTLVLDGTFQGKKMLATLRKEEQREFLLETRGFHWINEFPFNR